MVRHCLKEDKTETIPEARGITLRTSLGTGGMTEVKSTGYSRGLRLNSEHPQESSQQSLTPGPGDSMPSHRHTYRKNTNPDKSLQRRKKKKEQVLRTVVESASVGTHLSSQHVEADGSP